MPHAEIRSRGRLTLFGIEVVIISLVLVRWLGEKYTWDTFSHVIGFIAAVLLLSALFFGVRIFRYLFAIVLSLFWAGMAHMLALEATDSTVAHWVAVALAFLISLGLHVDYFEFERRH